MKINFYPFRKSMSEEVELCVISNKVDNLLSFCKSCVFMLHEKRFEPECQNCIIHQGITNISRKTEIEDYEFLGVC